MGTDNKVGPVMTPMEALLKARIAKLEAERDRYKAALEGKDNGGKQ